MHQDSAPTPVEVRESPEQASGNQPDEASLAESPVSSLQSDQTLGSAVSAGQSLQSPLARLLDGDVWEQRLTALPAYFTPPAVLTNKPDSIPELRAYARTGGWTRRLDGPVRRFGVWWFRLIALPLAVLLRTVEWIAVRPGRTLTVVGLYVLVRATTPGEWVVDNVLNPFAQAIVWALF